MGQLSQVQPTAIFDAEVTGADKTSRPELEIRGTTDPGGPDSGIIAIHVAVSQRSANGEIVSAAASKGVPVIRVGDAAWEARVRGATFAAGPATVVGQQLSFIASLGAFETFTWAQTITIEAGELEPDDETT